MGDSSGAMTSEENLVFGFNDLVFSDRILHLEIAPEFDGDYSDEDEESTASGKNLKAEKYNDWFSGLQSMEVPQLSDDAAEVKILHVCSLLLAGKSRFFYKLFKNGMRESQQKTEFCLQINASEEATLMDLLRFMYGETTLKATSFYDLVDLLIAADKFEVTSCMIYCVEMLNKFPMSLEHALLYLELPSSVLVSEIVKPLIDAAKKYAIDHYKCFTKSQDEAMQLTLYALEVVLGSHGLQVESEDVIFDFVLKWVRASYPDSEERREILTKRLTPLICFSNLSLPKLKEVLDCVDYEYIDALKFVHEALFSKVERSCGQLIRDSKLLLTTECGSAGRVYNAHRVVFFDLTRHECENLYARQVETPQFCLGGKMVSFVACTMAGDLGLYVIASEIFKVDFEIAVMKKSSSQFESKLKANNHAVTYRSYLSWSAPTLLNITRTELASGDCDYFINGGLRLRVELTLTSS